MYGNQSLLSLTYKHDDSLISIHWLLNSYIIVYLISHPCYNYIIAPQTPVEVGLGTIARVSEEELQQMVSDIIDRQKR